MWLFTPPWKSKDYQKRFNALEKLTNLNQLAEIAIYDESDTIRMTALSKISDEALLRNIAKVAKHHDVRQAALKMLGDTDGLIKSMLGNQFQQVEAVSLIECNEGLTAVASNPAYELPCRLAAFKKLHPVHSELADEISLILCRNRWPEDEYKNYSSAQTTVSDARKRRDEAARKLIEMAKEAPELICPFWTELKKEIEQPYQQSRTTTFLYPDDVTGYYYEISGVGIKFPDREPL